MRMAIIGALALLVLVGGGAAWWFLSKGGVRVAWDTEPPDLTPVEVLRLRGRAQGVEPSLTLDGAAVTLGPDGRFEREVPLKMGENVLTLALTARAEAGAPAKTYTEQYKVRRLEPAMYESETFYSARGSLNGFSRGASSLKAVRDVFLGGDVDVSLKAGELKGTVLEEYENDNRSVKGGVPMIVDLSVGEGALKVSLKPDEGPVVSAVARPGAPVSLRGRSEIRMSKFHVRLEALDGVAKDVAMRVRY